jgi:hypothetical protein
MGGPAPARRCSFRPSDVPALGMFYVMSVCPRPPDSHRARCAQARPPGGRGGKARGRRISPLPCGTPGDTSPLRRPRVPFGLTPADRGGITRCAMVEETPRPTSTQSGPTSSNGTGRLATNAEPAVAPAASGGGQPGPSRTRSHLEGPQTGRRHRSRATDGAPGRGVAGRRRRLPRGPAPREAGTRRPRTAPGSGPTRTSAGTRTSPRSPPAARASRPGCTSSPTTTARRSTTGSPPSSSGSRKRRSAGPRPWKPT